MKKRVLRCVVTLTLLLPVCLLGQTAAPAGIHERPRSSYDPAFAENHSRQQKPGGVETLVGQINPCNVNYGFWLDQAHLDLYQETLHSFLWWALVGTTGVMTLSFLYIYWLWHREEKLLGICSNMLSQLYNAHVESWHRADDLAAQYNTMMRRFNAQTAEVQEMKKLEVKEAEATKQQSNDDVGATLTENTRPEQTTAVERTAVPVSASASEATKRRPGRPKGNNDNNASTEGTLFDPIREQPAQADAALVEELKRENEGLRAQVHAQQDKIGNLRTQINQAHDRLVSGQQAQEGSK